MIIISREIFNTSVWHVDGTVTDTIIPTQSGAESNDNEGVLLNTSTEPSPSDALLT